MRGLHQAVTRAIASADDYGAGLSDYEAMTAAAIGVCLAEAQRAVEALEKPRPLGMSAGYNAERGGFNCGLRAALAVLAALAEDDA